MHAKGTMPPHRPPPRLKPPDRRPLVWMLMGVAVLAIVLFSHPWSTVSLARHSARMPSACPPAQANLHVPVELPVPAHVVTLQVHTDPSGTIMVACSPEALADVVAHLQQSWVAHGWQPVANLPQDSATSLAFVRNGVVVMVRISGLPTTPPTQRIIVTIVPH